MNIPKATVNAASRVFALRNLLNIRGDSGQSELLPNVQPVLNMGRAVGVLNAEQEISAAGTSADIQVPSGEMWRVIRMVASQKSTSLNKSRVALRLRLARQGGSFVELGQDRADVAEQGEPASVVSEPHEMVLLPGDIIRSVELGSSSEDVQLDVVYERLDLG